MKDTLYTEAKVVEKGLAEGGFRAIASTPKIDRHGETIEQEGWDIKNYKKAPRLLWGHNHGIPAIGKATKIWVEGTGKSAKLMFEGVFHEITELGRACKQLFDEGYIDTFSVGFLINEMEDNKFISQELLEISLVNVPANPDAMAKAYKSLKDSGFEDETINQCGFPTVILDKMESMQKDIKELQAVKEQTSSESPAPISQKSRQRLSTLKVIAKASDKILSEKKQGEAVKISSVKIIKLATEKLISQEKRK
ncbi:Prohead protease [uncultured Caudovirales phage]|uniref:Prohead protease n=1 Tax=uncultured Caudovirales phage TaxID=2100421 RepID=A0A6J5MZ47_9CAUD|nr:Prohead protease [uncultured Caudovirales phage]